MIGDTRKTDRTKKDGLELAQLLEPVLRHHATGLRVRLARPVERRPLEVEAELLADDVEHAGGRRDDLLADAVAGNERDLVTHAVLP